MKLLWAAVQALVKQGFDRQTAEIIMRAAVQEVTGQSSTKAVLREQVPAVLRAINKRAKSSASTVISKEQQELIGELLAAMNMTTSGYRAFCQQHIKRPWPQSPKEAESVIEALKAMLARRYPTSQQTWMQEALKLSQVSVEDRKFLVSVQGMKKLSISQLLILLKIGKRYGIGRAASTAVPDNHSTGPDDGGQ